MKHVVKQVKDWKNTKRIRNLNTFRLEESDEVLYSRRLFGFSHGTNQDGFEKILQSGEIKSSFNIREAQKAANRNLTGGDRGHDGQYTVYFRFVEKKRGSTDRGIPTSIVRSLGGVGGGSGYVFFVTLNKIVQSGACFALAGGVDGQRGINCFTDSKLKLVGTQRGEKSDPVSIGKNQFELGLKAAEANSRGNEIGFYDNVSLENVEIIMLHSRTRRNIPNYAYVMRYIKKNDCIPWKVYLRNGSTLNIVQPALRLSQASQASPASQVSQPVQVV